MGVVQLGVVQLGVVQLGVVQTGVDPDKTILVISATLIYNLIFLAIYLSKYKRYFCHIWFLSIHDTGSIAAAI